MPSHVVVEGLLYSYGLKRVVDELNFEIKKGQVWGLVGPNGAGKTTTIEMLATYRRPQAGQVTIAGYDLVQNRQAVKENIGFIPQEISLYKELTARENLSFFCHMAGASPVKEKEYLEELLELVGLKDRADQLVREYSGGMKRRLNIAVALVGRPTFLLMDEPTVGIDPQSRQHIYDLIKKLQQKGLTILYTSHYMQEVEDLCDQIAIMDQGKILKQGTLADLLEYEQEKSSSKAIKLETLFIEMTGRALRD